MKYRLEFEKKGNLKYIGHLDLQRVFNQIIRRAKIPVSFTEGFHPHIKLSFALPLPVGMTSSKDYADLVCVQPCDFINDFNNAAPRGLFLHRAYPFEGQSSAALTIAADYEVYSTLRIKNESLQRESILIEKRTKKGIKIIDIKPDIYYVKQKSDIITMRLSAGSSRHLAPQILLNELFGKSDFEINRKDLIFSP